ncbi:hypothetical protein F2P79_014031 [Pimephales promelas]|nr:hypothetical protein F2P79_014031 [Pimephales promelas]
MLKRSLIKSTHICWGNVKTTHSSCEVVSVTAVKKALWVIEKCFQHPQTSCQSGRDEASRRSSMTGAQGLTVQLRTQALSVSRSSRGSSESCHTLDPLLALGLDPIGCEDVNRTKLLRFLESSTLVKPASRSRTERGFPLRSEALSEGIWCRFRSFTHRSSEPVMCVMSSLVCCAETICDFLNVEIRNNRSSAVRYSNTVVQLVVVVSECAGNIPAHVQHLQARLVIHQADTKPVLDQTKLLIDLKISRYPGLASSPCLSSADLRCGNREPSWTRCELS